MTRTIGKYEISDQIGVGGFGAVFRARDPFIKRTVAIKTCQLNDEEIKSRFFREAELAGNLHHRNITTIYDFGVEEGIPYIVQEFLSGEDLDKVVKRGDPLTVPRKIEILMAVTEGLSYAHRHSIIHRDIKPSNIRILEDGSVKIMDFGIAKSLLSESSLTQTGITLGTSAYLAPEQIRGEPLDGRTDIFALGVLAYELLTSRKPFRGEHLSTVLYKILNETPEPIPNIAPEVPPALASVVSLAMDKAIDNRYPTMDAFRLDLQAVYRSLVGSSGRFVTSEGPTYPNLRLPADPDATIVTTTPSRGVERPSTGLTPPLAGITPPSGALARVPAPIEEDHTPTAIAMLRPPAGLELVHFQDGADKSIRGRLTAPDASGGPSRWPMWVAAAVLGVAIAGLAAWKLFPRGAAPGFAPAPRAHALPRPAPTAPLVFPTPILGQDASPAVSPVPVPIAAAPKEPEKPKPAPEPAKPARKFSVQFSSIPESTLFVDGKRIGSSIPARSVSLLEGNHTVRFEKKGLPTYEKEFLVGAKGAPPIAYRFPVGYLVIQAPAWTGATVLVDSKFHGVLSGSMTVPLSSGNHRVTLSKVGSSPLTSDLAIPQGEKKTWTPPPPAPRAESSS